MNIPKVGARPWRTRVLSILLVSFCLMLAVARAADLVVLKGSSVRLPVPEGITKITVADPLVIDVRPGDDGRSAVVSGLAEGGTQLRIERMQGGDLVTHVTVLADLAGTLDQVKALLSDVEGLDISIVGSRVVFKGNLLTKGDYDKVAKVIEAYPDVILNLSTFDRSQMNKYVEEAILRDIGLDTVTARVMGDTVILEGVVYSQDAAARAVEVAQLRVPNVRNLLRVQDVMVETDVQFVQISGDKNKDIGSNVLKNLAVGANFSGSGVANSPGGARGFPISFGVSASAAIQLNALVGNGTGTIVARPHISTKSGETGSFQSGGTKYFSIAGNVGGSLQSVDYGLILKVKPTLVGRDRILNQVSIEVSLPVPDATGVLTLQKYSTECTSLCKIGESMVLSGIVQQLTTTNNSKTPLLGDVPLLNLFFSEKTADDARNEFVIVVTPQPVFPTQSTDRPFSTEHAPAPQ